MTALVGLALAVLVVALMAWAIHDAKDDME